MNCHLRRCSELTEIFIPAANAVLPLFFLIIGCNKVCLTAPLGTSSVVDTVGADFDIEASFNLRAVVL